MKNPIIRLNVDPTSPAALSTLMIGLDGALRIALNALVEAKGGPGPWLDQLEEQAAAAAQGAVATDIRPASAEAEFEKIKGASEQMVRAYFEMARRGGA